MSHHKETMPMLDVLWSCMFFMLVKRRLFVACMLNCTELADGVIHVATQEFVRGQIREFVSASSV